MSNNRKPVPAGGQPIPAALAASNSTPATVAPTAAGPTTAATSPTASSEQRTEDRKDDNEARKNDPVEAAVLVAFADHQPDDIVTAPAVEIERLQVAGKVDPHPDAVAFARSLKA